MWVTLKVVPVEDLLDELLLGVDVEVESVAVVKEPHVNLLVAVHRRRVQHGVGQVQVRGVGGPHKYRSGMDAVLMMK